MKTQHRPSHTLPLTIDPCEVAASMAHGNDDKQAEFFAAFVRELRSACGTNYKAEMQMHMLADHLAPEDRELLGCLGIDGGQ